MKVSNCRWSSNSSVSNDVASCEHLSVSPVPYCSDCVTTVVKWLCSVRVCVHIHTFINVEVHLDVFWFWQHKEIADHPYKNKYETRQNSHKASFHDFGNWLEAENTLRSVYCWKMVKTQDQNWSLCRLSCPSSSSLLLQMARTVVSPEGEHPQSGAFATTGQS